MEDWLSLSSRLAREALALVGTPCFFFSELAARSRLTALKRLESPVPLRHWLSLKTQPMARLMDAAVGWGMGVEVVSEFELAAALRSGVPASRLLVNGVAKHQWLMRSFGRLGSGPLPAPGLTVHLDSLMETHALARLAHDLAWRVGLRCAVPQSHGLLADVKGEWDQFGMLPDELCDAACMLNDAGIHTSGVHFHLHTNVERADEYRRALNHLQAACAKAHVEPDYIDIGGGLPIPGERQRGEPCTADTFSFEEFSHVLSEIPAMFPSVREVWLEMGRFLTGAAGALVVTVLDKKFRDGRMYLICDGGRVNHARPAATEVHDIIVDPFRGGSDCEAVVCGPTCGAVDRLGCWMLPKSVSRGDMLIWLNAGAYHIPLETRFSFGLAPVVWFDEHGAAEIVRERETPEQWWSRWVSSSSTENAHAR